MRRARAASAPDQPSPPPAPKTPLPPQYDLKWECSPVSKRESCRLFASKDFPPLWNRTAPCLKDRSNSNYEFQICRIAFRRGLNKAQILTVIESWWSLHGIEGIKERLLRKTLPDAWNDVGAYVEQYQAKQEATKKAKTRVLIVNWIDQHGPSSPARIEHGLMLSHSKIQKGLIRLVEKGILERIGRGLYQRRVNVRN